MVKLYVVACEVQATSQVPDEQARRVTTNFSLDNLGNTMGSATCAVGGHHPRAGRADQLAARGAQAATDRSAGWTENDNRRR
jgi:hypothetical protein